MKKLFVVLVCLLFLGGCATLGWKPTEDQLSQYEQNLFMADFAETVAFVAFDTLCAGGTIPEKTCVTGYALDKEWDNAYALAMGAIADYRAGKNDKATMEKYVREATAAAVRITKMIKELAASKPATAPARSKAPGPAKK